VLHELGVLEDARQFQELGSAILLADQRFNKLYNVVNPPVRTSSLAHVLMTQDLSLLKGDSISCLHEGDFVQEAQPEVGPAISQCERFEIILVCPSYCLDMLNAAQVASQDCGYHSQSCS